MKALLFSLVLSVAGVSYSAQCEPSFGSTAEEYKLIAGSEVKGKGASLELQTYLRSHPSKSRTVTDLLGRPMFKESQINGEVKTIINTITDAGANSRIDRYCSESISGSDAKCVSLCVKWTNYLSRP